MVILEGIRMTGHVFQFYILHKSYSCLFIILVYPLFIILVYSLSLFIILVVLFSGLFYLTDRHDLHYTRHQIRDMTYRHDLQAWIGMCQSYLVVIIPGGTPI